MFESSDLNIAGRGKLHRCRTLKIIQHLIDITENESELYGRRLEQRLDISSVFVGAGFGDRHYFRNFAIRQIALAIVPDFLNLKLTKCTSRSVAAQLAPRLPLSTRATVL